MAQIAGQRVDEKGPVLIPHGAIQPQGAHGSLIFLRRGQGADENVGRVAHREHSHEYKQRHDEQHDHGLHQTPDEIGKHTHTLSCFRPQPGIGRHAARSTRPAPGVTTHPRNFRRKASRNREITLTRVCDLRT